MTYMIRVPVILFLILTGCASIDLGYIELFQDTFKKNLIEEEKLQEYKNQRFSFLKASKGRNDAIFILRESNDLDIQRWIGANAEEIYTFKGMIIKTIGLDHDFKLHDPVSVVKNFPVNSFQSYSSLANPNASFLESQFNLEILEDQIDTDCNNLIIYKHHIRQIGFNERLEICLDKNSNALFSKQKINPFDEEIVLYFYYKY